VYLTQPTLLIKKIKKNNNNKTTTTTTPTTTPTTTICCFSLFEFVRVAHSNNSSQTVTICQIWKTIRAI